MTILDIDVRIYKIVWSNKQFFPEPQLSKCMIFLRQNPFKVSFAKNRDQYVFQSYI